MLLWISRTLGNTKDFEDDSVCVAIGNDDLVASAFVTLSDGFSIV